MAPMKRSKSTNGSTSSAASAEQEVEAVPTMAAIEAVIQESVSKAMTAFIQEQLPKLLAGVNFDIGVGGI